MDDGPVLAQVNLVVASTAAAVEFYGLLGVPMPELDESSTDHLELPVLAAPNLSIELDSAASARIWNASWRSEKGGTAVVLGFSLPTRAAVDTTYTAVTAAGHPGVQPPFDAFWGSRYAIVADPDGNQVGLMSPADQERTAWPAPESPDP